MLNPSANKPITYARTLTHKKAESVLITDALKQIPMETGKNIVFVWNRVLIVVHFDRNFKIASKKFMVLNLFYGFKQFSTYLFYL